jgi:hypothetical protein
MRVAQIILAGASQYELKSQRIDAALPGVECVEIADGCDLAHVYGSPTLPRVRIGVPYVANARIPQHWWQPRIPQPRFVVTPFDMPEAVEEAFFTAKSASANPGTDTRYLTPDTRDQKFEQRDPGPDRRHPGASARPLSIGVFLRRSVQNIVEQTMHRLQRTREDIAWNLFKAPPGPQEIASVDVWIDPAINADDYDGFTAEALVSGQPVVASRTSINMQRTEKGRTALLVPPDDSNELTHAILAALFKPEVGRERAIAAQQTISKFRPRYRHRALAALYETLLP